MEILRQTVVDLLRNQGDEGTAVQAEAQLPERVDTERDAGLLEQLGVNLDEVAGGAAGLGDETGFDQARDLRRGTDLDSQSEEP
jgi:hypothetical protein